jgi:glyoxylase-like metal-dependent hydrolase (beta-lactamase superfamily II)
LLWLREDLKLNELRQFGAITVYLGAKSGKYPDGNQVIVHGADLRVAFDTPLAANRIGPDFDEVDLVILGHVHEDHMAGLHRVPHARIQVHEADLDAARSWAGLCEHYGYPPNVLAEMKTLIERDFHYVPRPDATAYRHDQQWDLGGGARIRAHHLPGHTSGHCALSTSASGSPRTTAPSIPTARNSSPISPTSPSRSTSAAKN